MAPRKTPRFLKRVRTPGIFESKAAEAAIGSDLLPVQQNRSGPVPLPGGGWPFQTMWAFPESGDQQVQCERVSNYL